MKLKKTIALFMITIIMVLSLPFSVSAHSQDRAYELYLQSGDTVTGNRSGPRQKKDNSTSSYVKSEAGGMYKFICVIYGASTRLTNTAVDCTTTEIHSGKDRTPAIVTRGTKGFVRQDVYERFGENAWAQIYAKPIGYYGDNYGVWSPDSVPESGCIEYN